jgi:hypothetical protein
MTEERAYAIVRAINSLGLGTIGIGKPDAAILEDVSLRDMLDAAEFVDMDNKTRPANADGSRSFSLHPDPRLISAVYTLLHYRARSRFDEDEMVVGFADKLGLHFLVVGIRDPKAAIDELEELDAA